MKKLSRILFLIFGIIAPILIGALHTFTHFNELVQPEVKALLINEIPINGQSIPLWNSWGLMSFMMGMCFIIIGGLNITTFRRLTKEEYIPAGSIFWMIVYTACAMYGGYQFNAIPQLIGGMIGGISLTICLIITLFKK